MRWLELVSEENMQICGELTEIEREGRYQVSKEGVCDMAILNVIQKPSFSSKAVLSSRGDRVYRILSLGEGSKDL
jgi:hypothetical protein